MPHDPPFFPTVPAQTILASIVESSDDAIVSKDLNGVITSWNEGAERIFGYSAAEMIGTPILRLLPPDRVAEEADILAKVRRAQKVDHFETVRRHKDGTLLHVSVTVSPIRDARGVVVGASKIARDITARKRAEAVMLEADRRRTEFLAMLGHELRNPLAAIQSALGVMRQPHASHEHAALAEDVVSRQVSHLARLVDDLLDADRISRGRLTLRKEPIQVATMLANSIEAMRPRLALRQQTLTVEMAPEAVWLNADATRVAQVLGNLLDNASKFTQTGGAIHVSCSREPGLSPDTAEVVIRIRDNGMGIAQDQLARVFDLFTQVDTSLERSVNGLGIGLTLVRTLVEMHGGTVQALSEGLGHGSEFVVRLPAASSPPCGTMCPSRQTEANRPALRVLVVDDNRDAAEMLSLLIRCSGHESHRAHDGDAAVKAVAALHPDVVLLDIGLPGLNGLDAARLIRALPQAHPVVLVAVTGWGHEDDRRRSAEAGFDAHWVKPVDPGVLDRFLAGVAANLSETRPAQHH